MELYDLIIKEQENYVNTSDTILEDGEFDALVNLYESETGKKLNLIGAPVRGDKFKLPFPMPSLSKVKGDTALKEMTKFIENNPGPYLISDKLDGSSIQIDFKDGEVFAYSGGDGEEGSDVTFILEYLDLPIESILEQGFNITIRGELVMSNKNFESIKEYLIIKGLKAKNSRGTVNGIVNGKKAKDKYVIEKCSFVAFSILSEIIQIDDEYELLNELGFQTPHNIILTEEDINTMMEYLNSLDENKQYSKVETIIEFLKEHLQNRVFESEFRIDGSVMISIPNSLIVKTSVDNPKYAIAFKVDTHSTAIIKDIQWRPTSRYGYFNPVAIFETPVHLLGQDISEATAHSYKFVCEHNLGKGSLVILTLGGDITPKIVKSLNKGIAVFPSEKYYINEKQTELVAVNLDVKDIHIAKIAHFIKTLKIKHCGPSTIEKLYDSGITNISKFLRLKKEDIIKLERMGDTSSAKLIDEIKNSLKNITFETIMTASGFFGEGLGEELLKLFIQSFPCWITCTPTEEEIMEIHGFGEARSQRIIEGIPLFLEWLDQNRMCYPKENTNINQTKDLVGQVIVFTGIGPDLYKLDLENRGAIVKKSWVVNCSILIVKEKSNSKKTQKAIDKGIPIITIDQIDNIADFIILPNK